MSDKEFVSGLFIKPPNNKAPDYVKCAISIKRADLGNWLRSKDDEWINLDVKTSKDGRWYAEVNNWKPKQPQAASGAAEEFDDQEIPF